MDRCEDESKPSSNTRAHIANPSARAKSFLGIIPDLKIKLQRQRTGAALVITGSRKDTGRNNIPSSFCETMLTTQNLEQVVVKESRNFAPLGMSARTFGFSYPSLLHPPPPPHSSWQFFLLYVRSLLFFYDFFFFFSFVLFFRLFRVVVLLSLANCYSFASLLIKPSSRPIPVHPGRISTLSKFAHNRIKPFLTLGGESEKSVGIYWLVKRA